MLEKEKIMDLIEEIGFLTGSRRFGLSHSNSDFDFVILFKDFQKHMDRLRIPFCFCDPKKEKNIPQCIVTNNDYNKDKYFRSYNVSDKEYNYNIIMVWQESEFRIWKEVTNLIEKTPLYLIKEKKDRVLLFETLKTILRNRQKKA